MHKYYRTLARNCGVLISGLLLNSYVQAASTTQHINFSGFYMGPNFGYSEMDVNERLNFDFGDDDTEADTKAFDYDKNLDSTMFTTGIRGGYGHQFNKFYMGGELALDPSKRVFSAEGKDFSVRINRSPVASAELRLGIVPDPSLLLYAIGGLSYTQFEHFIDFKKGGFYDEDPEAPDDLYLKNTATKRKIVGRNIGTGFEYRLFQSQFTIRFQYLYTTYARMPGGDLISSPKSEFLLPEKDGESSFKPSTSEYSLSLNWYL